MTTDRLAENQNDEGHIETCGGCGSPNFRLYTNGTIVCRHCETTVENRRWFDPTEPYIND